MSGEFWSGLILIAFLVAVLAFLVFVLEPATTCIDPRTEHYVREGFRIEEARWLAARDC